jgi:hypothetical protein
MGYLKSIFWCVTLLAAALAAAPGCSRKSADDGKQGGGDVQAADAGKKPHDHEHPEFGPRGGALAEWGDEEYHAELVVDRAQGQATVYLLDGLAKKDVPTEALTVDLTITSLTPPVSLTLKADPQKKDPEGKSSRFVGTHDKLKGSGKLKGEITGKMKGTPYTGTFEEKEKGSKDKKE